MNKLYMNDGNENFITYDIHGDSNYTRSIEVADLNEDGNLDIITGNAGPWAIENETNKWYEFIHPEKPSTPSGETYGFEDISYDYSTSATDPEDNDVSYGWDWDGDLEVDEWTSWYSSGETCKISHMWNDPGTFSIRVKAKNMWNAKGNWSEPLLVTIVPQNNPPNKPTRPSGPLNGRMNVEYTFTTSTTDPEGEQIYYLFDWGDGNEDYAGPFNSGETGRAKHTNLSMKCRPNCERGSRG